MEESVRVIQRVARRFLHNKFRLDRLNLISRLRLEATVFHGLRLMLLFLLLFASTQMSIFMEQDRDVSTELGLRQSYISMFGFDKLEEIDTLAELNSYLRELSRTTRAAQVTSSDYFQEAAEIKVIDGARAFTESLRLAVDLWVPITGFTITLWLDPPMLGGSNDWVPSRRTLLRKPLDSAVDGLSGSSLSCWELRINRIATEDEVVFVYGAHDHGNDDDQGFEQVVLYRGTAPEFRTPNSTAADRLRFVALVFEPEGLGQSLSVYLFDTMINHMQLPRPVTDCAGNILDVGSIGVAMADLTYYPRNLSQEDIADVLAFGLPRLSVTRGKSSFVAESSEEEQSSAERTTGFALAALGQESLGQLIAHEEMLSRHEVEALATPVEPVPVFEIQTRLIEYSYVTTRAMSPPNEDSVNEISLMEDRILPGRKFMDLLPAHLAEGHKLNGRIRIPDVPMHGRWFPAAEEFTLTLWMKVDVGSMVDLSFFFAFNLTYGLCWSAEWFEGGLNFKGAVPEDNEFEEWRAQGLDMVWQDFYVTTPLDLLDRDQRSLRHTAFVRERVNSTYYRLTVYLDGAKVVSKDLPIVHWWNECDMIFFPGSEGDVQVGQAPNEGFRGELQQARYYVSALNSTEVQNLHDWSWDPDTQRAIRTCYKVGEVTVDGADAVDSVDVAGHDCAWYYEARQTMPALCDYKSIQESCPWACGVRRTCGTTATAEVRFRMSPQIIRFALEAGGYGQREDCAAMPEASCLSCAFDDIGSYDLAQSVKLADAWSMSFWMQKIASNVEDPIELLFRGNGETCSLCDWNRPCDWSSSPLPSNSTVQVIVRQTGHVTAWVLLPDGAAYPVSLKLSAADVAAEQWLFIGVAISSLVPRSGDQLLVGQRYITLTVNARSLRVPINSPATIRLDRFVDSAFIGDSFFDHLHVGGHILFSSLEFYPLEKADWEFQNIYYSMRSEMRHRTGPKWTRKEQARRVSYTVEPFRAPGFIVAPPVMLQTRAASASLCPATTGQVAIQNVWAASLRQCTEYFYECPLITSLSDLASLISCNSGSDSGPFLGRNASNGAFGEFLLTATEASLVFRDGNVYQTADLLNADSSELFVLIVLAAPDHGGRVSLARVDVEISTKVKASYSVKHFRAIEPGSRNMRSYVSISVVTFVLTSLLILDAVCRACWQRPRRYLGRRGLRFSKLVVFDFVLALTVMVIFGVKLSEQLRASDNLVVYLNRLMDESRWETDDPVEQKFDRFVSDNAEVQDRIDFQETYRSAAMVVSGIVLFRLIVATQAHPRIAILIDTLSKGADALIHYFVLLILIFGGFVSMGMLFFGSAHEDFGSLASCVSFLSSLMLTAEFPQGLFNESWGYVLFVMCYIVIFFLFMLNFVLAIIVNMYSKVQSALDELQTEQFVFLDMYSCVEAYLYRVYNRWPHSKSIIESLEHMQATRTVTAEALENVSETWALQSRFEFVRYYRSYDFLAPQPRNQEHSVRVARKVEERLAVLIGCDLPSEADHALFQSALTTRAAGKPRTKSQRQQACDIKVKHLEDDDCSLTNAVTCFEESPAPEPERPSSSI